MLPFKTKRIVVFLLLALTASSPTYADSIDELILKNVPILLSDIKEIIKPEVKVIAVLPFRLKHTSEGQEQFSGAIIQTNMAKRVQNAIALFRDPQKPIDVIFDALAQARKKIPDANFLNAASRKALFNIDYALPVNDKPVKPDLLLTGVVEASEDWSELRVSFEYVLKSNPEKIYSHSETKDNVIKTDYSSLVATGKGYKLTKQLTSSRGMNKPLRVEGVRDEIENEVALDKQQGIDSLFDRIGKPLPAKPFEGDPVLLTIKYDGQPQDFLKDSVPGSTNFSIKDPKEGQVVTFELTNETTQRVGVVITVNGHSLSDDEAGDNPDAFTRFILEPKTKYEIPGIYQKDRKGYQKVVGLSDNDTSDFAESLPTEVVGLIHMYVYQSQEPTPTLPADPKAPDADRKERQQASAGTQLTGSQSLAFEKSNFSNDDQMGISYFGTGRDGKSRKIKATGSFSVPSAALKTNSWDQLAQKISENLRTSASSGRGLMAGTGDIQPKEIPTDKLGEVAQTHAYIIRYLSMAELSTPDPQNASEN
jgi:hypothetical protein